MSENQNDNWDKDWDKGWEQNWQWSGPQSWIWGIALILVGGLFLLDNFSNAINLNFYNWWAIFILVPGINMISQALGSYRVSGELTSHGNRRMFWGLFLIALAVSFLFNLSWSIIGPAFLILAGLYMLFIR